MQPLAPAAIFVPPASSMMALCTCVHGHVLTCMLGMSYACTCFPVACEAKKAS